MMSSTLEEQLMPLLEKVDRILLVLETRPGPAHQRVVGEYTGKEKPSPLGSDDITRHQERFEKLYGTWDAGEGLQVGHRIVANGREDRKGPLLSDLTNTEESRLY